MIDAHVQVKTVPPKKRLQLRRCHARGFPKEPSPMHHALVLMVRPRATLTTTTRASTPEPPRRARSPKNFETPLFVPVALRKAAWTPKKVESYVR